MSGITDRSEKTHGAAREAAAFLRADGFEVRVIRGETGGSEGWFRLGVPGGIATLTMGRQKLIARAKHRAAVLRRAGRAS